MEIIFLDRKSLTYKDHAQICDDFELNIDIVLTQKSNFVINKSILNANIGDIAVLKSTEISYIGILETIENINEFKIKVQTLDFNELFNIKIPVISFQGDVCNYIKDIIERYFITNEDFQQNLGYLRISSNIAIEGTLTFGDNTLMSFQELIKLLNQQYNIYLKYKVHFLRGRFSNIEIVIDSIKEGFALKSNLSCLSEINISNSEEQLINKIVFYPKKENIVHKEVVSYFLLKDGSLTIDKSDERRFSNVCFTCEYYGDGDYDTLLTKAQKTLSSKNLDHNISFKVHMNNSFFVPFKNVLLGDNITFIHNGISYETVVSQLRFKNNFLTCDVTLGDFRNKLTDKIKLLSKSVSNGSSVSVIASSENIDGGTY